MQFIFRPEFWARFWPQKWGRVFSKKAISVAPKKILVTQISVAFRARGGAKRINQRVAYVCAAGARPELHVQTRPRWRRCLRVGARAAACTRAQARVRMTALTHRCKNCKRLCSQKNNGYALSEYEGRVRNRYRFLTPKTGPFFAAFFNLRGVVSLAHVPEIFCRTNSFLICT